LSNIQSITDKRGNLPILANIYLGTVADKRMEVNATDLDLIYHTEFEAEVDRPGKVLVSSRHLFDIFREVSDDSITISLEPGETKLVVQGERSVFKLLTASVEEFPKIEDFSSEKMAAIDLATFKKMIDQTLFTASTEEARYNLNGIYLEKRDDTALKRLRMTATDGHRLSLTEQELENSQNIKLKEGVILPRRGLAELRKQLDDGGETLYFQLLKNRALFRKDQTILAMRLVEGKFPDYSKIIPAISEKKCVLKRAALYDSVRRVAAISADKVDKIRCVHFHFGEDGLKLTYQHPEIGDSKEEIREVLSTVSKLTLGFNSRFLLEVLQASEAEDVTLYLNDEVSPIVVKFDSEPDYINVIMPIRL
jgi:DNA polymerase-3 subunit beta